MGGCELESGDAVPAAIPIRKMKIGITQTFRPIIGRRISDGQDDYRRPPRN
jgi:hypothetical protein